MLNTDRKKLTNLSSVKIYEVLFKTKDKSSIPPVWSGCEIYSQNINTIPFRFSYDDDYPCTNSKHYEIVASNRDIIFNQSNGVSVSGGNLVTFVKGDENYLNSFFADGYKPVYPYLKRTCLWLKNLPCLYPTNLLPKPEPTYVQKNGKKRYWVDTVSSLDRQKIRSKTFPGLAAAMAFQFTNNFFVL